MDVVCEIKEFMASRDILQIVTIIPEGVADKMRPSAASPALIASPLSS